MRHAKDGNTSTYMKREKEEHEKKTGRDYFFMTYPGHKLSIYIQMKEFISIAEESHYVRIKYSKVLLILQRKVRRDELLEKFLRPRLTSGL